MSSSRRRAAVTIYVADDDPAMLDLVASTLAAEGYQVHQVGDGQQLLDALLAGAQNGRPADLVVSDVAMPRMNGTSACAAARSAGLDVPFIVMTAFASAQGRAAAELAGASVVLDKPFDMVELLAAVCGQLQSREAS